MISTIPFHTLDDVGKNSQHNYKSTCIKYPAHQHKPQFRTKYNT